MQVSTNMLSSKPVLRCLQSMTSMPLAEELVQLQKPQQVNLMDPETMQQVSMHGLVYAADSPNTGRLH